MAEKKTTEKERERKRIKSVESLKVVNIRAGNSQPVATPGPPALWPSGVATKKIRSGPETDGLW